MDRMRRLYKIMLCLEIGTTLSHLDTHSFVREILDIDDDDSQNPEFLKKMNAINEENAKTHYQVPKEYKI